MNTQSPDHSTYREWLYLELDGALNVGQQSQLRRHLEGCSDCQREKRELTAFDELLVSSRIGVQHDFVDDVMASLPTAAWESRNPRSWVAAIAIVFLLILGSGILIATAGDGVGSVLPAASIFVAVGEMLRSSVVAGAGRLGASWKGLGLAFERLLSGSIWNLLAIGALVVAVDILLIRLLRRRQPSTVRSSQPRDEK